MKRKVWKHHIHARVHTHTGVCFLSFSHLHTHIQTYTSKYTHAGACSFSHTHIRRYTLGVVLFYSLFPSLSVSFPHTNIYTQRFSISHTHRRGLIHAYTHTHTGKGKRQKNKAWNKRKRGMLQRAYMKKKRRRWRRREEEEKEEEERGSTWCPYRRQVDNQDKKLWNFTRCIILRDVGGALNTLHTLGHHDVATGRRDRPWHTQHVALTQVGRRGLAVTYMHTCSLMCPQVQRRRQHFLHRLLPHLPFKVFLLQPASWWWLMTTWRWGADTIQPVLKKTSSLTTFCYTHLPPVVNSLRSPRRLQSEDRNAQDQIQCQC